MELIDNEEDILKRFVAFCRCLWKLSWLTYVIDETLREFSEGIDDDCEI